MSSSLRGATAPEGTGRSLESLDANGDAICTELEVLEACKGTALGRIVPRKYRLFQEGCIGKFEKDTPIYKSTTEHLYLYAIGRYGSGWSVKELRGLARWRVASLHNFPDRDTCRREPANIFQVDFAAAGLQPYTNYTEVVQCFNERSANDLEGYEDYKFEIRCNEFGSISNDSPAPPTPAPPTPSPPSPPTKKSPVLNAQTSGAGDDGGGGGNGMIIAIVVIVLLILAVAGFCCYRKKKQDKEQPPSLSKTYLNGRNNNGAASRPQPLPSRAPSQRNVRSGPTRTDSERRPTSGRRISTEKSARLAKKSGHTDATSSTHLRNTIDSDDDDDSDSVHSFSDEVRRGRRKPASKSNVDEDDDSLQLPVARKQKPPSSRDALRSSSHHRRTKKDPLRSSSHHGKKDPLRSSSHHGKKDPLRGSSHHKRKPASSRANLPRTSS